MPSEPSPEYFASHAFAAQTAWQRALGKGGKSVLPVILVLGLRDRISALRPCLALDGGLWMPY